MELGGLTHRPIRCKHSDIQIVKLVKASCVSTLCSEQYTYYYYDKQDVNNNGLGKDEMMGILDAGLQMRFISELESNVRNALGLDEFRLVRDTSSDIVKKRYNDKEEATTVNREVYKLEMGKYLTDKLMVNYTMGIDYTKHEIGLRYEMNPQVSVTASIDDQHRTWFGLETRFRF